MSDFYVPVVERYVGDDWMVGPFYLSARRQRLDLSNAVVTALVYATDTLAPVATLTEDPGVAGGLKVAADRQSGTLDEIWVSRLITSAIRPQDRRATHFPTRVCIIVQQGDGRVHTGYTVLFRPLDRRTTCCSPDPEWIVLKP